MYFKMLKHDLRHQKGLNVILFLFITIASVLVFVGSVQIFSNVTRSRTTQVLCKTSDMMFFSLPGHMEQAEIDSRLGELLDHEENVADWCVEQMVPFSSGRIDYPDFDEKEHNVYSHRSHLLCTLPRKQNLAYDSNDRPFYVPNGCIAIPQNVAAKTGTGIGDTIRYSTQTGLVYELTVSTIFKDNCLPFQLRFIVSDADFTVLTADYIRSTSMYCVRLRNNSFSCIDALLNKVSDELPVYALADSAAVSEDYVMMEIVSVFIVIISIFLILIILMTIRFTMIAQLKEEEKEIGMMKALGVESFRFRWLFAAKYTAFALIGGGIGIAAGIPLSGMVISLFGPDAILPQKWEMLLIGILSVVFIIAVMITFSMLVMRRIRKISVIDALHGENSGERFSGRTLLFLHRLKHLGVPSYLAVNDLIVRLKRYLFLLIAYTLGTAILLLPFNARNSVIHPSYSRLWLYHHYEYSLRFDIATNDAISREMERTGQSWWEIVNEQIADAGIPAHIDTMQEGQGTILFNDSSQLFSVYWGEGQAEQFTYQKGGRAPTAPDEAAMSAFTANRFGVVPGDKLTIKVYEVTDDHTGAEEREREITITGLFDYMEDGTAALIFWDGYEDGYSFGERSVGHTIDAPDAEKPAVIAQLRELYGEAQVLDARQGIERELDDYDSLFKLLIVVVSITVIFVLALITYLYETIFIHEEVPEIALLKSMGFRDGAVRRWHLLRMVCLTVLSAVCGEALFWSCGSPIFRLFMQQYEVTGIRFLFELPVSFLLIPALVAGIALLITRLTLTGIRRIDIRRISEE